jgi:hypothetical protein
LELELLTSGPFLGFSKAKAMKLKQKDKKIEFGNRSISCSIVEPAVEVSRYFTRFGKPFGENLPRQQVLNLLRLRFLLAGEPRLFKQIDAVHNLQLIAKVLIPNFQLQSYS